MIQMLIIIQQLCFTIAYIPQIFKLVGGSDSGDISIPYYLIRVCGLLTLQLVYMLQSQTLLALTNLTGIGFELIILFLVLRNRYFYTLTKTEY